MSKLTVYSYQPESTQLACAYLGIEKLGIQVVLRPLADYKPAGPLPRRRLASLRAELEGITLQLVDIGEQLEAHQNGSRRLGAGEENGLYAQRDALQARQRGIQGHLQAVKGGQGEQ
jgi:hypothetical protein